MFILSNLCYFINQFSSTRRLAIVYMKQPVFFSSFDYPQRAVYTLFILSNLCCFYGQIILIASFTHCLYEATCVVFIIQLSSTRRLAIVYIKPLLFLSFNYPQRAV